MIIYPVYLINIVAVNPQTTPIDCGSVRRITIVASQPCDFVPLQLQLKFHVFVVHFFCGLKSSSLIRYI